ncbi:hypothetical protein [Streptomyces sp. NPDC012616]|uniref:hypothetical protein n=1 Tax=Streptomyces sp. NPDC012616 TaxID=3364840 RepID=UPI0036EB8A9D
MVIEEWPSISWMSFSSAPGRVGEGRGAVAEAAAPDRREVDPLVQLDEPSRDVGGVEHLAVPLGEDAAGLHPGVLPLLAVLVLLGAVPLESLDRVRVQRDGPRADIGLGVVLVRGGLPGSPEQHVQPGRVAKRHASEAEVHGVGYPAILPSDAVLHTLTPSVQAEG